MHTRSDRSCVVEKRVKAVDTCPAFGTSGITSISHGDLEPSSLQQDYNQSMHALQHLYRMRESISFRLQSMSKVASKSSSAKASHEAFCADKQASRKKCIWRFACRDRMLLEVPVILQVVRLCLSHGRWIDSQKYFCYKQHKPKFQDNPIHTLPHSCESNSLCAA